MWCDDTTDVPLDNDPPAARHHMLYATGPQDEVLTNNPEYTFWKTEHTQYHSFGQETKEYLFKDSLPDGTLKQAFGRVHTTKIPVDDADLLGPLVLQVSLPPLLQSKWFGNRRTNWIRWSYGGVLALVKKVELVANGTILQEFNSRILDMEANMVVSKDHQRGYNRMTGRNESNLALEPTFYYLPLPFWFCRTTGTSRPYLPMCALSRNVTLELRVTWEPLSSCVNANHAVSVENEDILLGDVKMTLLASIVTLDPSERMLFTTANEKRYLIEEYQEQEDAIQPGTVEITKEIAISRNIKRLHWVVQDAADVMPNTLIGNNKLRYEGYSQLFLETNYNSDGAIMYPPPIRSCQLLFSSEPREPLGPGESTWLVSGERVDSMFYTKVQPLLYEGCNSHLKNYIFGYFFALHPFAFEPSGTYNMSATTNHLHLTLMPNLRRTNLYIYSVGYNILKIDIDGQPSVMFAD